MRRLNRDYPSAWRSVRPKISPKVSFYVMFSVETNIWDVLDNIRFSILFKAWR